MPLSNAERQARWRERHIERRRDAQRIVNLLMRRHLTDGHIKQVAALLALFFNREGIRDLRRELQRRGDPGRKEKEASSWQWEKDWRALWKREHPGRTLAEYDRLVRDYDGEVWQWRRAKGRAANEAERLAYERDHPGQEYPEHECALSGREFTDLSRWRRQRQRKRAARP